MQAIIYYVRQLQRLSGMKLYLNLFGMVISGLLESSAILLLVPMLGMVEAFSWAARRRAIIFPCSDSSVSCRSPQHCCWCWAVMF